MKHLHKMCGKRYAGRGDLHVHVCRKGPHHGPCQCRFCVKAWFSKGARLPAMRRYLAS